MTPENEFDRQLSDILNKAPCGIGLFDIETSKPVFLNTAYYDLVGYTPQEYAEIAGAQTNTLVFHKDRPTSRQTQADFNRSGSAVGYEYRIVRKDGSIRWIKMEASTILLAGQHYAFCSFTDITREQETAAKLNLIAENTNESISLLDISGGKETLLFANARFYRLLGITPEKYEADIYSYDRLVTLQADRERLYAAIKNSVEMHKPGEMDYRIQQPGGTTLWVRHRFVAVRQDAPNRVLLVSAVSDITRRKEQELLLALEKSRYELVVDSLGAAVFEWNRKTGAFYASEGYGNYAMSRVDPTDIFNNRGPMDLIHPDDIELVQAFFRASNRKSPKTTVTLRLKMTSGEFHWCRMSGLYYWDEQGNPTRTIGVLVDVNEEHEKTFMLNTLMNELPGGVAVMRLEPRVRLEYFSEGFAKLSGSNREEVQQWVDAGEYFEDTIAASDRERVVREIRKACETGCEINTTYRFIKKNGGLRWVHLAARRMGDAGKFPIYYCVFTPPTEESLLYRSLIRDASVGVYVGERKTKKILYMNAFAEKLAGAEREQGSQERTIGELLTGGKRPLLSQEEVDGLSYDRYSEFHIDRPSAYLIVKAKAMLWNEVDAYVLYISDETNEHRQWLTIQQQAETERTAEKAIRDSRAKSEFLSRMSHDMRTPMNGILGLAELSEDETDIEVLKKNMAQIKQSGQYLLGLINDTLDYQRMETGRMSLEPQAVDARRLIESILSIIRPAAQKKGVRFRVDLPEGEQTDRVRADPMRLKEILINLLSNAIKFTPAGGTVCLGIHCLERQQKTASYRITVADTGIGMSEDFIKNRIFKPFSQESNEVSALYVGSGLGLSIAKNLVELMGGSISVESRPGQGTTFTILLDLEQVTGEETAEADEQDRETVEAAKQALAGKRILLAEDHPLNAEIATRLLQKAGCVVTWVKNGQECVDTFRNASPGRFELILMDIRMPVLNGLAAAAVIRSMERPDAPTVPILAMTANAYAEDIERSRAGGMNGHISKPIVPAVLYCEMAKALK